MSVKITVSYSDHEEVPGIIRLLKPISKKVKNSKDKKGGYYHTYIEVEDAKNLVNTGII